MPNYRSKLHSPLDATSIKYRSSIVSPLDATSPKYRSTCHSPLEAFQPAWFPPTDWLWAWFKNDEGSGLTVIDYSPVAKDAKMYEGVGIYATDPNHYWDLVGFGKSSSQTAPYGKAVWASSQAAEGRPSWSGKYAALIGFLKLHASPSWWFSNVNVINGHGAAGGADSFLAFGVGSAGLPAHATFVGLDGDLIETYPSGIVLKDNPGIGAWFFFYIYHNEATARGVGYARASGGALTLMYDVALNHTHDGSSSTVYMGVNGASHYMGDILCYRSGTSADACLTVAQVNDIYDNLKSRYGMT